MSRHVQLLRTLIAEELDRRAVRRAVHAGDVTDFIEFAKRYSELSEEYQLALEELILEEDADICCEYVDILEENLGGLHIQVDQAINKWRKRQG